MPLSFIQPVSDGGILVQRSPRRAKSPQLLAATGLSMRRFFVGIRPRTCSLVVLNALLLVCLVWCMARGTQTAPLLATAPRRIQPPEGLPTIATGRPELSTLQDHALFHASRRYVAPIDPRSQPTIPPIPEYQLVGTFSVPNKPSVALLKSKGSGASRQVHAGEELEEWRVEGIEARRIVLKHGEQFAELTSAAHPSETPTSGTPEQGRTTPNEPQLTSTAAVGMHRVLGSVGAPALGTSSLPAGRPRIQRRPF